MTASSSSRHPTAKMWRHFHRRTVYMIGVSIVVVLSATFQLFSDIRAFSNNSQTYIKPAHENPVRIPDDWIPLLDKPFYIYDELLMLDRVTLAGQENRLHSLVHDTSTVWSEHSQDLWFTLAALEHPMRTRNPAVAQLFVVPFLTHLAVSDDARSFCWEDLCGPDVVQYVDEVLRRSPYWKEKPHIMVATHPNRHSHNQKEDQVARSRLGVVSRCLPRGFRRVYRGSLRSTIGLASRGCHQWQFVGKCSSGKHALERHDSHFYRPVAIQGLARLD